MTHKSTSPAPSIVSAFDSYKFHVLFKMPEVFSGGLNFGSLFLILQAKQSNVLAHPIYVMGINILLEDLKLPLCLTKAKAV